MRSSPVLFSLLAGSAIAAAANPASHESAHDHGAMPAMAAERPVAAELSAHAAFDAQGTVWAVHKVSGHIAVSHSRDRGTSWSSPVLVTSAPEPTDPGGDARPKIALGPRGEIYVTWTRPLSQPFTGEIKFARSLDGGRTFLPPMVVHQDRQQITHRFDTIAVNAEGQVFVAWIDKRDLVAARGDGAAAYRGAAVYFAVSDDRGGSFRGDYKVADHSCECCRIAMAARADGGVTVLWRHVFAPNIRDHAIATLHPDGRATAMRRATFEDWKLDGCPHHGPAVAVDGNGRAHAVWFSGEAEHRGVFYGRLDANGVSGQRRIGGATAGQADVAVEGSRVAIAWREIEGGVTWLRGMRSEDGGDSWAEFELRSASGATDHPRVLSHGGQFHVFWPTQDHPLSLTPFPRHEGSRGSAPQS